jgi:hypothetical protein
MLRAQKFTVKTIALLFVASLVAGSVGHSQSTNPPPIEWQRSFGGSGTDDASCIRQTLDGGYIVGGYSSSSISGTKTSTNFGSADCWIVRLDQNGNQLWDRSFGETNFDILRALQQTSEGGFILAGGSLGDLWVVRVDEHGDKQWERRFGSPGEEQAAALQQTSDGGFIAAGWTQSATGIPFDGYVVRMNSDGNKLWEQSFGGSGQDQFFCLQETADGGFVVGGTISSFSSGTEGWGSWDFWLMKLDGSGSKLWEKLFGGTQKDEMHSLQQTADGGFILGGHSASPADGNKTSPFFGGSFNGDFWIVRLDAEGTKLWDKSFGGRNDETVASLQQTADGGFILAGDSTPEFDPLVSDIWVVRLDAEGNKVWEQTFGGSASDRARSVRQTSDGGFIIGGYSRSPADGNKTTTPLGAGDFWVIKLAPDSLALPRLRAQMQTFDEISANGYRFFLSGISNRTYVIEYSETLTNWAPLQTNYLSNNEVEITDASGSDASQRFYRARLLP